MPTINVYLSDETYRALLLAAEEVEKQDSTVLLSVGLMCTRLANWFAKSPDTPLRRSAIK